MTDISLWEINYKNDYSSSRLAIKPLSELYLAEYQIRMLLNNKIRYLLPFNLIMDNNIPVFYYDITSVISLRQLIKSRKWDKKQIFHILSQIACAITSSGGYLLYEKNFLLNIEYIFVNPALLETRLVYIPAITGEVEAEGFGNFVKSILKECIEQDQSLSNDRPFEAVFDYCNKMSFNLGGLKHFVDNILVRDHSVNIKSDSLQDARKQDRTIDKNKYKSDYKKSYTYNQVNNEVKSLIKISTVVRNLFKKMPDIIKGAQKELKISPIQEEAIEKESPNFNLLTKNEINKTENSDEGVFDTEILFYNGAGKVILMGSNGIEDIIICIKENEDYIIGRMEGQVNYTLRNKAVGKLHAVITCRQGKYYIKDLNSRNGTFINSIRIESNRDYELLQGNKITFANCEFMFLQTPPAGKM